MKICSFILSFFFWCTGYTQDPTIGVLYHSKESSEGYTLMAPNGSSSVFLIDVCGRVIHEWETLVRPALRTTLTEEGVLLRTSREFGNFAGGGTGGKITAFDWDSNELWEWVYVTENEHLHHDIDILPNGNILAIAWESFTESQAIAMGRDPERTNATGIWPDQILEYDPVVDSIVWRWRVIDHIIQDFDNTKPNFGVVADHPELFDINLLDVINGDWNHFNSVYYNEELDQIVISSRNMNEIYIIDHSTTNEEAAGHTGGRYGKGGDILYRWGNPENYGRGDRQDRKLFGQHDARWIKDGPHQDKLMVFNNGFLRPAELFSSVEIIDPPVDNEGNYSISDTLAFFPENALTVIDGRDTSAFPFYSARISGAFPLPNSNILVCHGMEGFLLEYNLDHELVWAYRNPLNGGIPLEQGEEPFMDEIFKTERYPFDYPAFEDKDLTPKDPLEINPTIEDCILLTSTMDAVELKNIEVFPNPTDGVINFNLEYDQIIELYNAQGQKYLSKLLIAGPQSIELSDFEAGLYFLVGEDFGAKILLQ